MLYRSLLVVFTLSAGCAAKPAAAPAASPAPAPAPAAAAVTAPTGTAGGTGFISHCPAHNLEPGFAAELFPGCSPMPFDYPFSVCRGACPRPCSRTEHRYEIATIPMVYDEAGRWLRNGRPGQPPDSLIRGSCSYQGDHMDRCTDNGVTFVARRDARGRIVALDEELAADPTHNSVHTIDRDDRGDVVKVSYYGTSDRYVYNDRHQLVEHIADMGDSIDRTTFTYDDQGRPLSHVTSGRHGRVDLMRFSYDGKNRVARVDTQDQPDEEDNEVFSTVLVYDDRDRLIRVKGGINGTTTVWNYDCSSL